MYKNHWLIPDLVASFTGGGLLLPFSILSGLHVSSWAHDPSFTIYHYPPGSEPFYSNSCFTYPAIFATIPPTLYALMVLFGYHLDFCSRH